MIPFNVWSLLNILFSDRKIQFFILLVLAFTLVANMFFEIPKLRKRIKFLAIEVYGNSPGRGNKEFIKVDLSNNSRRDIKDLNCEDIKIFGVNSSFEFGSGSVTLSEGDQDSISFYFREKDIDINNIRYVTFADSVNKKYTKYLYKGEFKNRFIVWTLILRDKIVSFFNA